MRIETNLFFVNINKSVKFPMIFLCKKERIFNFLHSWSACVSTSACVFPYVYLWLRVNVWPRVGLRNPNYYVQSNYIDISIIFEIPTDDVTLWAIIGDMKIVRKRICCVELFSFSSFFFFVSFCFFKPEAKYSRFHTTRNRMRILWIP